MRSTSTSGGRDSRRRCSATCSPSLDQRLVKDRHLKLALDLDGRRFNAIWFRRTELLPKEAYGLRIARWRTTTTACAGCSLIVEHAALPYNPVFSKPGSTMEAEHLNQIEGTVADLRGRLAELRRYL